MHRPNTFSLLKKQLDQNAIRKMINSNESDKHCKGFNTYNHLIVMVYAQLAEAKSLRDLVYKL